MTVRRFLAYMYYSKTCPQDVTPIRWRGMLKWHETRKKEGGCNV